MQKPLQDHIKWIYPHVQNNQSNSPACPQLLGLHCVSQSTFCSFGFILTCAMGVTTANDESDFNSHGFSISKYCADSSTWQIGSFVTTKHFMLLVSHHVYNGGEGKEEDTPCQSHRKRSEALSMAAGLPGVTLPSLSQHVCPVMEAAEMRVGSKLETWPWWQGGKLQHGLFRVAASQARAPRAAPISAAALLRSHFKSAGFKEKG